MNKNDESLKFENSSSRLRLSTSFLIYGSGVSQVTKNKDPRKYTEGPLAWSFLDLPWPDVSGNDLCVQTS